MGASALDFDRRLIFLHRRDGLIPGDMIANHSHEIEDGLLRHFETNVNMRSLFRASRVDVIISFVPISSQLIEAVSDVTELITPAILQQPWQDQVRSRVRRNRTFTTYIATCRQKCIIVSAADSASICGGFVPTTKFLRES